MTREEWIQALKRDVLEWKAKGGSIDRLGGAGISMVSRIAPELFDDPEFLDWKKHSFLVAMYAPSMVDHRFDWEGHSWAVAQYCPDRLDPERYNWKEHSWAVAQYCPDRLDPERYNWEEHWEAVVRYAPDFLEPQRLPEGAVSRFKAWKELWGLASSALSELGVVGTGRMGTGTGDGGEQSGSNVKHEPEKQKSGPSNLSLF